MSVEVIHQPDKCRFVSSFGGEESVLEYSLLPDHGIDFKRTFVPESMRGSGVAEKLVRTGIRWAREQGYEMTASCWYAKRFLRKRKRD
jgi:predicted GNAT family acetyltransferase